MGRKRKTLDEDKLVELYARGGTYLECARSLGIGERTLYEKLDANPALRERCEVAKTAVDDQVVGAAFEVATRKRIYIPRHQCDKIHSGHAVCSECRADIVVEQPDGDPRAQQFWLKNRRPDRWRDKIVVENSVPPELVTTFARAMAEAVNLYVEDPGVRGRILEAFDAASAGLEHSPRVH